MDCFSQLPDLTFPVYSPERISKVQECQKIADKALRNINLLYNEIMTPEKYDLEDPEIDSSYNEKENVSHSNNTQNHYVSSCCNSVQELCMKCDRFISRCNKCSKCCISNNKNLTNVLEKMTVNDCYPSSELKCTVPKPFSFCDKIEEYQKAKEDKISKIKQDLEAKVENEMKVKINFKPVPKSTHLPLYNQMVQEEEERKAKRREKCHEKLNNTKPFNLHSSSKHFVKSKSTADLIPENAQFKAKPIPKHILSNKVSEKLKNKDEIRKLLVSERAKQTMEKSSLPFSQKAVPCTRSCVDFYNLTKTQNKKQTNSKNIDEITKRLYVKKCSVIMEDWNKKVLEVNTDKQRISQKIYNPLNDTMSFNNKKLSKKEELPFMYFPVRMSNASLLREKQIREEITARKEREKVIDEKVPKKQFNNDILHKLKYLIPPSEGEKEIEEKVKNYRISQIKRQQEYEKELEEILKKVSVQNLLLERQSKVKQRNDMEIGISISNKENSSYDNETLESVSSDSDPDSSNS